MGPGVKAVLTIIGGVLALIVAGALLARYFAYSIDGATVTSWWRNPLHNAEVGGLKGSAHLIAWAVDLIPVSPEVLASAQEKFPVVVNEGTHIHAAFFRA